MEPVTTTDKNGLKRTGTDKETDHSPERSPVWMQDQIYGTESAYRQNPPVNAARIRPDTIHRITAGLYRDLLKLSPVIR